MLPATTFLEHYDIAKGYGAYHLQLVQPVIAPVGEARPNHEVFRELRRPARSDRRIDDGARRGRRADGSRPRACRRRRQPRMLDGRRPLAPGGGRPVQFVDVLPKTPDGRSPSVPGRPARRETGCTPTSRIRRRIGIRCALISPASEHTISSTLGELRPGDRAPEDPSGRCARRERSPTATPSASSTTSAKCTARRSVTPEVRPGTVSLPKGLWARSTFNGATSNALVPDTLTDIAGGACFNDAQGAGGAVGETLNELHFDRD